MPTAKPGRSRAALLTQLDEAIRRISAQSVLISDLVAARVGLNSTDLECLDLVYMAGPTTAGRLAAHAGLTTGAMTAVLDRLEQAGFVRRRRDAEDRRRVLVEAQHRRVRRIEPLYAPLAAAMAGLHERYDDRQLAVVLGYMTRALALGAEHVAWLQDQAPIRRSTPRSRGAAARRNGHHGARRAATARL